MFVFSIYIKENSQLGPESTGHILLEFNRPHKRLDSKLDLSPGVAVMKVFSIKLCYQISYELYSEKYLASSELRTSKIENLHMTYKSGV